MAEVFLARLPGVAGFQKTLVLKRILPHLSRKKHFVDLFVAEATLAAEVRHRNVVQVFELGQVDGELYMAMEYVEGHDLRRLLRCASKESLRIPPWFTVHVICEVLEALSYGYDLKDDNGRSRRVVHRDVTPSNIFISNQGEVKLGDFGVARDDTRREQTRAGQLKGKVAYMAPEQLYSKAIDQRTDLFAVGVVLWECLAQRRLFGGRPDIEMMNAICQGERQPPSARLNDIPPELDEIVIKALQPQPDARFESAATMQRALYGVLETLKRRVATADVRAVQHGLTKMMGAPDAGLSGMANIKHDTRTGDSSAPSFTALSPSEDSLRNSNELLANPMYGDRGDSVADLDLDIDIKFVETAKEASAYGGLTDDLAAPQVPASSPPNRNVSSKTGLQPLDAGSPAAPTTPTPRPRSASGVYGFVKQRRSSVPGAHHTSDVPVIAGQAITPPQRAPSSPRPRTGSHAGRVITGTPAPVHAQRPQSARAGSVPGAPVPQYVQGRPTEDIRARPSGGDFDMDALVQEAVQDVQANLPSHAAIPQESLIAGLDSRRTMGDTRRVVSDRWAFVVDRGLYEGPHPCFIRDHEGSVVGPWSYEQALAIVKLEVKAGYGEQVGVGVVEGDYIRGRQMMELLGMFTMVRGEMNLDSSLINSDGRPPIKVFAEYTRNPISGRLVLFREGNTHGDYREVEMLAGEPTFVWTENEDLQYPQMLVSKRLLRTEAVVELAHHAVRERRPLEAVAGSRLGTDLSRYRSMLMKERLVDLFAKGYSYYALRERVDIGHTESFAPNLLQVALELSFRCISRDEITGYLAARAGRKVSVAGDYDRIMARLSLSPDILQAANLITKGKTLDKLLDQNPQQRRTLSTLAYFLLEAELIYSEF